MEPKVIQFEDLADFIKIIREFPNHKWIFRGQPKLRGDSDGKMILPQPKAGRKEYFCPDKPNFDLDRFERWSHQALAFCPDLPVNDFERLAYARHQGLATRLLDWTLNAAVALYFATETDPSDPQKHDGGVFIYRKPTREVDPGRNKLRNCRSVMYYAARPVVRRIMAQDGVFTIHPHPERPVNAQPLHEKHTGTDKDLAVLRVPADRKRVLQEDLRDVGILARSVYPDLEGLSDSINLVTHWETHPRH